MTLKKIAVLKKNMDLIKHSYRLGMEGFRFGEARVRYNSCLFTNYLRHLGPSVGYSLAFLLAKWVGNIEMILRLCFLLNITW